MDHGITLVNPQDSRNRKCPKDKKHTCAMVHETKNRDLTNSIPSTLRIKYPLREGFTPCSYHPPSERSIATQL